MEHLIDIMQLSTQEIDELVNTATDIISGEVKFHQTLAPFVPAEDITNTLEFDPDMLYASINGGSN